MQLPNGEGIVAVAPLRARLKRLEAHAAAGCVEYQLFGESLATSDAFAAAAGADLPPEEAATALPTAFGRWLFRTMDQEEIDEMVMQLEEEEKESEVRRARDSARNSARNSDRDSAQFVGATRSPFGVHAQGSAETWYLTR